MTTDTQHLAPTDAELMDLGHECELDAIAFGRAVLAKWSTPPAVAGKPWGACVSGRVFVGGLPDHVRKLAEAENLPIQWLYTTPQPTQAQAEPKSGAKSFQTYGEANAYSKGYYAGKKAALVSQPAGYALVPVEPSAEMVDAAQEAYMPFGDMQLAIQLAIAAAPQPVAREPLTLDEFRKAFHEYTGCIVGTNQGLLMAAKSATERAHGITKGGQHGAE